MAEPLEKLTLRVEPGEAGERLDVFLAQRASRFSRSRLKALIKAGAVSLNDEARLDPAIRVATGDSITLAVPPPEAAVPAAEPIPLAILYEDDDVIVIDKPAGLVVHPGAGNLSGTLVNALIAHCGDSLSGIGGVKRPGIVHRLDKDTSGVLVVAKNDAAHRGLSAQFADHGRKGPLKREYDALVWGVPDPHIGSVGAPLKRDDRNRQKQAVARLGGRRALTHYRVAEAFGDRAALVTCRLETGRTHQIRVHMAHIGHPLVGDAVYGAGYLSKAEALPAALKAAITTLGGHALHARLLCFRHPRSGEILQFEADWPAKLTDLAELFRKLTV
jgi:23S rRNA pseudouridine1911/1915/1917 synthase